MLNRTAWACLVLSFLLVSVACGGEQNVASQDTPLPPLDHIPITPGVVLSCNRVIQYVGTHSFAGGDAISGGPPTLVECWGMMSKLAEEKLHNTISSDNRPIIYVKLKGPFIITNLKARYPTYKQTNLVEEVFDATTGDLMMWGVTE